MKKRDDFKRFIVYCLVLEKKKVRVTGELPAKKMYLKPLYNFINQRIRSGTFD